MHFVQFISNNLIWLMPVALPFVIAAQVYFLARKMSEPEKMLVPCGLGADKQQILTGYQEWLSANNFYPVASFQFSRIQVATFRQKDSQRFFSFTFHQRLTFSIETYFDDDDCTCLDTGTSGSTGMFPRRPHQYQQSFPNVTPDEAWRRHLEAENYLASRFGIQLKPLSMPYEQILLKAMRLRMQFVRSIPFYPFCALYWFFVTRNRMANRSIQQQFP
jgi:hypothetical protein